MRLRLPRVERLRRRHLAAAPLTLPVVAPPHEQDTVVDVEWTRFKAALMLDETYAIPPHELARATVGDLEDHVDRLKVMLQRAEEAAAKSAWVGPPATTVRRLKVQLEAADAAIARIFSLAYQPSLNSEVVGEEFFCGYCGTKLHGGRHEAYERGSLCPACSEAAKGVKPEPDVVLPDSIEEAVQAVLRRAGIGEK